MNRLILCEGKTDAVLLSYYLEKTCGWMHVLELPGQSSLLKRCFRLLMNRYAL